MNNRLQPFLNSLISYEQLTELGCDGEKKMCSEKNSWVYTTSYWTGSAYDEFVWIVYPNGFIVDAYDCVPGYGVRPVVNISESEIK